MLILEDFYDQVWIMAQMQHHAHVTLPSIKRSCCGVVWKNVTQNSKNAPDFYPTFPRLLPNVSLTFA